MKLFLVLTFLLLISCSEKKESKTEYIQLASLTGPLDQEIPKKSEWLVDYFKQDKIILDYSLQSVKNIDTFFDENSDNGNPKKNSKLSDSLGYKLFAISCYIGQVIIKNSPGSKWIIDDRNTNDTLRFEILIKDSTQMWPSKKVMKRYKNGSEDGLYSYVYMVTKGL